MIAELEAQQTDTGISVSLLNVLKGVKMQGTFAHELLAISYAGWISPAFQLKVNQVFLDYRTGKTGQYQVPSTVAGMPEKDDRTCP